jgi:hypothetical protein
MKTKDQTVRKGILNDINLAFNYEIRYASIDDQSRMEEMMAECAKIETFIKEQYIQKEDAGSSWFQINKKRVRLWCRKDKPTGSVDYMRAELHDKYGG